ncbi:MAG: hypothetical protein LBS92_04255 [Candidatus Methanoplasma sp.]|jgi:hypothetical protein|nr:hypothetical protein [Candidatus Methanoplasma sp.]
MNIDSLLSVIIKKAEAQGKSELIDDALCIDCRGCVRAPEIRSNECVRCIVRHMADNGSASKVRMRTALDTELSGPAVDILGELASIYRSASSMKRSEDSRSCRTCDHSCKMVFSAAWAGFPDPYFDAARSSLARIKTTSSECTVCVKKTLRAIDQAELCLGKVKDAASCAGGD